MNILRITSLVLCAFLFASCSSKKPEVSTTASVEELYNDGVTEMGKKHYDKAIEKFEELQRTYPYSNWSTKSEIMSAYASYKDEKYDAAVASLDRFVKLHPGNVDVPYAYYLKALCYYEQISEITKDQSYSDYAKTALQEVITRFPDTKYSLDAQLKIDLVNDHLAGKEVDVGRYYIKHGNIISAINRFQIVIKKYDTTAHVPEALHRLVEAHLLLGARDEAIKYAAVLGYNFPESKWYERSYDLIEGKKSFAKNHGDSAGKWYDFRSWKGMTFRKSEPPVKDGVVGRDLIEDIDLNVESGAVGEPLTGAQPPHSKSKGWFSGWRWPFFGK
ncbi:MAG: transporter [Rickettsiaceae bacterium]|jgi:outer membrane protein assembly factor BamD|nr:transporter [Rickettsiaceae bacterium]